jgi:hypothetical protein
MQNHKSKFKMRFSQRRIKTVCEAHTTFVGWAIALACVLLLWTGCQFVSPDHGRGESSYNWHQRHDSIALQNCGRIVWQLNYKKQEGKPYFHPLCLIDGTELTRFRPADHLWHRALWFSWKHINGINYWDPEYPDGQTEIINVKTEPAGDYSARIEMTLAYHPANKPAVLTEKRILVVNTPDKNGCYYIDWLSIFTAGQNDVLLDRTPIPGEENAKPWGGYAGLSVRMAENTKHWRFLSSEGILEPEALGNKARWVDFSGETSQGKFAGITIFDHPDNLRHPSAWWLSASMPYFNPALLFHKPYALPAKKSLELRYRILVHTGIIDNNMLERQWQEFATKRVKTCPERSRRM